MKPKRPVKQQPKQNQKTPIGKNAAAQRLIKAMEKPHISPMKTLKHYANQ